jgi:hypothetical protein
VFYKFEASNAAKGNIETAVSRHGTIILLVGQKHAFRIHETATTCAGVATKTPELSGTNFLIVVLKDRNVPFFFNRPFL